MLPLSCDQVNTPNRHISQRPKITKSAKHEAPRAGFVEFHDQVCELITI
jgi:hypothetical protein